MPGGFQKVFEIAETTGEIALYKRLVMANPKRVVSKAIRDSVAGKEISVSRGAEEQTSGRCRGRPEIF